jgi:hypothetical protein
MLRRLLIVLALLAALGGLGAGTAAAGTPAPAETDGFRWTAPAGTDGFRWTAPT